eukprot:357518-Chlamydomonas_euryale.AAC.3
MATSTCGCGADSMACVAATAVAGAACVPAATPKLPPPTLPPLPPPPAERRSMRRRSAASSKRRRRHAARRRCRRRRRRRSLAADRRGGTYADVHTCGRRYAACRRGCGGSRSGSHSAAAAATATATAAGTAAAATAGGAPAACTAAVACPATRVGVVLALARGELLLHRFQLCRALGQLCRLRRDGLLHLVLLHRELLQCRAQLLVPRLRLRRSIRLHACATDAHGESTIGQAWTWMNSTPRLLGRTLRKGGLHNVSHSRHGERKTGYTVRYTRVCKAPHRDKGQSGQICTQSAGQSAQQEDSSTEQHKSNASAPQQGNEVWGISLREGCSGASY